MVKNSEGLINARQAAKILGVSAVSVYKWTREGAIRAVKLGDRVLFDIDDLNLFVESRKVGQKKS